MTEVVKCPTCDGEKEFWVRYQKYDPGRGRYCEEGMMPCYHCNGNGVVDARTASWQAQGAALRQKRQDNDHSLREEATRLKISVWELSEMEMGHIQPIDYDRQREMIAVRQFGKYFNTELEYDHISRELAKETWEFDDGTKIVPVETDDEIKGELDG